MDLIEDEPRQQPKPVPFCQSALLQPMVPEVSLLLQDNFHNQLEKKNDSFSGTEFQTYNSWRWKHMNQNSTNKLKSSDSTKINKSTNIQDCYLIKDKYFTSDAEKRKNEILYGDVDEPRRPLPPRTGPVIPTPVESFFSNASFDDPKPVFTNPQKVLNKEELLEKKIASTHTSLTKNLQKELDNSEKLYSIISEQNKQMQVLQKQIDQLLKLQEVKDKQIEQLLNSQESKEKKIEQLMQSLDSKGKEIENFFNLKEKQEQHIQELLRFNENKQKENLSLIKELNELKQRQRQQHSVGVMASTQVIDASTCTSLDDVVGKNASEKTENSGEQEISCIRDSSRLDEKEKSLSLHSSDLPVIQENVPTPQSSIHLDIQDFPDSSDDSETEEGNPSSSISASRENQSNPLGYTFYNNVLTQLKDIIQNSGEKENSENNAQKPGSKDHGVHKPSINYNFIDENQGTVRSFHSWNVFEKEIIPCNDKEQEASKRISDKCSNVCLKDTNSPSDISLKINALALKYLKQEQISQCGLQPQIPTSCQHDVTIYNVTNLSFGSMRYLDRYQMLPHVTENQKQMITHQKNETSPGEFLRRRKRMSVQQNLTSSIGNILDISTLNQQPKLL